MSSASESNSLQKAHGSSSFWSLLVPALMTLLAACASHPSTYVERHEIKNLTVVFLDEESLHEEYRNRTGHAAIRFHPQMNNQYPSVKTLRGFYDYVTHTLYCPKWNFEVCGHELHHAVVGNFHPTD